MEKSEEKNETHCCHWINRNETRCFCFSISCMKMPRIFLLNWSLQNIRKIKSSSACVNAKPFSMEKMHSIAKSTAINRAFWLFSVSTYEMNAWIYYNILNAYRTSVTDLHIISIIEKEYSQLTHALYYFSSRFLLLNLQTQLHFRHWKCSTVVIVIHFFQNLMLVGLPSK